MTDDDKALVERDTVCAGDKPYTNGIRDLAEMPHVSEQLGNVFRDCARIIDARNDRIEALTAEVERLREALTQIARLRTDLRGDFSLGSKQSDIARAALGETK